MIKGFRVEIKKEIKDFPEFNDNDCTMYTHSWNTVKALLRGKIIALNGFMKN